MPYLISKEEALSRINEELNAGECLACTLLENKFILNQGQFCTTLLSMYPRFWGQTMIVLNSHKTSVSELTKPEWNEMNDHIFYASKAIEKTLTPLRCYISCLGSVQNLPNTCPHLHFNIIPIYSKAIKPVDVYTWEHGVYNGTPIEWEELYTLLSQNYTKD